jgi:hypothetical protein
MARVAPGAPVPVAVRREGAACSPAKQLWRDTHRRDRPNSKAEIRPVVPATYRGNCFWVAPSRSLRSACSAKRKYSWARFSNSVRVLLPSILVTASTKSSRAFALYRSPTLIGHPMYSYARPPTHAAMLRSYDHSAIIKKNLNQKGTAARCLDVKWPASFCHDSLTEWEGPIGD